MHILCRKFTHSEALPIYIIPLISMAINVRFLNTGTMTAIDDSCIESIFHHNRLQKLEELRISKSSGLSITVAYQLIHQCPYLRSIRTLESWSSVSELVSFFKLSKIFPEFLENLDCYYSRVSNNRGCTKIMK